MATVGRRVDSGAYDEAGGARLRFGSSRRRCRHWLPWSERWVVSERWVASERWVVAFAAVAVATSVGAVARGASPDLRQHEGCPGGVRLWCAVDVDA